MNPYNKAVIPLGGVGVSDCEKWHRKEWMSDDQWECSEFLAEVVFGFHHLRAKIKPFGAGIEWNPSSSCWATFDSAGLTRLVFLAHDRCIRVEIHSSGPGRIRITAFKRKGREGSMFEKHPTLEQAIDAHRRHHPVEDIA